MTGRVLRIPVLHGAALRSNALHEAAHGVVALALGLDVDHVTVCRLGANAAYGGWMQPTPGTAPAFAVVVSALAGRAAEIHAFGGAREHLMRNDVAHARAILSEIFADDRVVDEEFQRLAAAALEGVREHWSWIQAVARELLIHGTLSGREVLALRPPTSMTTTMEGATDGLRT